MAHEKYTTKAFLVASVPLGEADRFLYFFTKDFGMVKALAKSIRLGKSKRKPYIEIGNLVSITILRGREVWRLAEIELVDRLGVGAKLQSHVKTLSMLKSLVQGEEKNEALFEAIEESFGFIQNHEFDEEELEGVECFTIISILSALGYGSNKDKWGVDPGDKLNKDLIFKINQRKKEVVTLINNTLKETHL